MAESIGMASYKYIQENHKNIDDRFFMEVIATSHLSSMAGAIAVFIRDDKKFKASIEYFIKDFLEKISKMSLVSGVEFKLTDKKV